MTRKTYSLSTAACRRLCEELKRPTWPLNFKNVHEAVMGEGCASPLSVCDLILWARENDPAIVAQIALAMASEAYALRELLGDYFAQRNRLHDAAADRWPTTVASPYPKETE